MSNYFRTLLTNYYQKTASSKEKWLVDQFFDTLQTTGIKPEELESDTHLKKRLARRIYNNTIHKNSRQTRLIYSGIAASFLIALGSAITFLVGQPKMHTLVAQEGEQLEVYLEDSTLVYLNGGSRFTYPEEFKGDSRTVYLEGEAFFKVRHKESQPFIVKSADLTTEVLGTEFNVNNYPDSLPVVTVNSGKVRVISLLGNHKMVLTKNQQAIMNQGAQSSLARNEVKAVDFIKWHWKSLNFNHATIESVIADLSDRFNTAMALKSETNHTCTISGNFSGANLEDVLESLKFIYDIQYEKQANGTIALFAGPCSNNS